MGRKQIFVVQTEDKVALKRNEKLGGHGGERYINISERQSSKHQQNNPWRCHVCLDLI